MYTGGSLEGLETPNALSSYWRVLEVEVCALYKMSSINGPKLLVGEASAASHGFWAKGRRVG